MRKKTLIWASIVAYVASFLMLQLPQYSSVQAVSIPLGCPGSSQSGPLPTGTILDCPSRSASGTCKIVVGGTDACTPDQYATPNASLLLNDSAITNAKYTWVNAATIQGTFIGTDGIPIILFFISTNPLDNNGSDKFHDYKARDYGSCHATLEASTYYDGSKGTLDMDFKVNNANGCQNTDENKMVVPLGSSGKRLIAYKWSGTDKLVRVDGNADWTFTKDSGTNAIPNGYLRDSELSSGKKCVDRIIFHLGDKLAVYELDEKNGGSSDDIPADAQAGDCKLNNYAHSIPQERLVDNLYLLAAPANDILQDYVGGLIDSSGSEGSVDLTCSAKLSSPLTWVLCPALGIMSKGAKFFDDLIQDTLQTNLSQFDESAAASSGVSRGEQLFTSWSYMRRIALLLSILILLAAIISQAIGIGPFDAYTIKKVLPRAIAAIILMTVSWYLCKGLIAASNGIGKGIEGILYAPFNQTASDGSGVTINSLQSIFQQALGGGDNKIVGLAVVGGAGVALSLGSIGVILVTVGMAFFAAFIGFLVIIARNIAIIALVLTSPLAAMFWVLPNTKKYADFWWDAFSKGLMMYPLIVGMLAIGKIFAFITLTAPAETNANDTTSISNYAVVVIAIIAYYGPYFIIPKTFALAGGLISRIAGVANDRSRGLFDRGKAYNQKEMAQNWQKNRAFSRFNNRSLLGRGANAFLGAATAGPKAWVKPGGLRAARETNRTNAIAAFAENDATFRANSKNDHFLLAVANQDLAMRKLNKAREGLRNAQAAGNAADIQKYQAEINAREQAMNLAGQINQNPVAKMAAAQALSATGYQFSAGQEGYNELAETMAAATGATLIQDENGNYVGARGPQAGAWANAMNTAQFNLKNAGRTDMGGVNNGAGLDIKAGIRKLGNYQRSQGKTDTYYGGAAAWLGSGTVGEGGKTLEGAQLEDGIVSSVLSGETQLQDIAEWHSMLLNDYASASDQNKIEINKQLQAIENMRIPMDSTISRAQQDDFMRRLEANRTQSRGYMPDPSEIT